MSKCSREEASWARSLVEACVLPHFSGILLTGWSLARCSSAELPLPLLLALEGGTITRSLWAEEQTQGPVHARTTPISWAWGCPRALCAVWSLLLLFTKYFILCVWMVYVHICLCTTSMPSNLGDQNSMSDILRLEWQTFVDCHSVLGIKFRSSGSVVNALNYWVICPVPSIKF